MSLSRISHRHRPHRHTLDNSHQALSVYSLCSAFLLKEAVPGLLVTHICAELDFHSWPGSDPLPSLFLPPSVWGLGKSVWLNHATVRYKSCTTSTCSLPSTGFRPRGSIASIMRYCWFAVESSGRISKSDCVRWLWVSLYHGYHGEEKQVETHKHMLATHRAERNERKWGLMPVSH